MDYLQIVIANIVGDILMSSATVAYLGPFTVSEFFHYKTCVCDLALYSNYDSFLFAGASACKFYYVLFRNVI